MRVLKLVEAVDCGQVVNPQMAEGQVEGAAMQSLGYALYERMPFDATGRMQFRSFRDYTIATAIDVPEIVTILVPTHEPTGPVRGQGHRRDPDQRPRARHRQRGLPRHRRAHPRAAAHAGAGAGRPARHARGPMIAG